MSAGDHLNEVQFVNHRQLANMTSSDFDAPVHEGIHWLRGEYEDYRSAREENPDYHPDDFSVHAGDRDHGGPDKYVAHLAADIAKNGIKKPLEVQDGQLRDGNHRALAAIQLKLDKIPVTRWRG